jgi:hypothetical protein
MAARKRRGTSHEGWTEEVRDRIRSSMLINRLINHALGECDMSNTQVRAAEVLLRKALPDLSSAEIKQETTHRYVARIPEKAVSPEKWQQQHAPETTQH